MKRRKCKQKQEADSNVSSLTIGVLFVPARGARRFHFPLCFSVFARLSGVRFVFLTAFRIRRRFLLVSRFTTYMYVVNIILLA